MCLPFNNKQKTENFYYFKSRWWDKSWTECNSYSRVYTFKLCKKPSNHENAYIDLQNKEIEWIASWICWKNWRKKSH